MHPSFHKECLAREGASNQQRGRIRAHKRRNSKLGAGKAHVRGKCCPRAYGAQCGNLVDALECHDHGITGCVTVFESMSLSLKLHLSEGWVVKQGSFEFHGLLFKGYLFEKSLKKGTMTRGLPEKGWGSSFRVIALDPENQEGTSFLNRFLGSRCAAAGSVFASLVVRTLQ